MKKLVLISVGLLICLVGVFSVKNSIENYVRTEIESVALERKSESFLKQIQGTESKFNPSLSIHPDFREIANNSINTVVHVKSSSSPDNNFSIEDFLFGGADNRPKIGSGSGVIISSDGYIVTNYHVIENAEKISITTNNNQNFEADIVGYDEQNDIALLKIESENSFPFATFGDSDASMIGEWVLAVGNPFNLTSTVTAGIISAKSRSLDPTGRTTQSYIQTDAAVNPGNSGGALINTNGELIGINTAIQTQTGSYVGYSFAVPSNIAKKVIEDILEYGTVQYGFLGVTGLSLDSKTSIDLETDETEGFYINSIDIESGAFDAGIQVGDIIKSIDGIKISKFSDLKGYLNTKRPNDIVEVKLISNDDIKTVKVQLNKNERISFYLIGILKNLNEEEVKKRKIDNGVKIYQFNDSYKSYWNEYGINENDIITKINGININSIDDIDKIVKSRNYYDPISIEILTSQNKIERFNFR